MDAKEGALLIIKALQYAGKSNRKNVFAGQTCEIKRETVLIAAAIIENQRTKIEALETANVDQAQKLEAAQRRIRELETGRGVVHGRWVGDEDGFYTCTACGEKDVWDFKHCPSCGAQMDAEKTEGKQDV